MQQALDTRQLRAFVSLARRSSFTQAGRELFLTQSAISHAIKALEADLGCQLFHRQGKSVHLTQAGRELLPHAETILQVMGQARASLGTLDETPKGKLCIACTEAAAQFILPAALREFKESFELYEIQMVCGETPAIIDRLMEGGVDLAVSLRPMDVSRLDCHPIFDDDLEFLVPPLHPWASRAPKLKEIADDTFIVASRNSLNFMLIQEFFLKLGVRLNSFIELGSSEATKELVQLGIGVAIAPRWMARQEIEAGQLVAVPMPKTKLRRSWIVSTLQGRVLNLAERRLIQLCEQVGRRMT